MKAWLTVIFAVAIAGCGAVASEGAKIQQENAAEDASVKRIVVVQTADVPGHPKYTQLGSVEGVCGRAPAYDDDNSSASPGFKHAAYNKYGDKVDAIINVNSWFVLSNQASAPQGPGNAEGHLECKGIAVHFD
ncbi:MAG: hypothetical protein Q7S58_15540 [Candidatus Binatus sp.]|uniref:hypothetical protein n=1 Tax=Candidatus Binatus sp. TaxID=2811406 RepID=UPI00271E9347|nr:hypothetical protein [Candidatus Binatus sp.]MDO8433814.1 hypothetical protein [Candidatus Binatus sp.]